MNWARPPVKFLATGADTQAMKLRSSTALAAACLVSAAIPGNGVAAVKVSVPCGGTRGGASGLIAAIKRANAHGGGEINVAQGCTYTLLSGNFDNGQGATALPLVATRIAINGQNSGSPHGLDRMEELPAPRRTGRHSPRGLRGKSSR